MIWSLGLFGMILWLCLKRITSQFSFLYCANSQQQSTQESLYCKVKTPQYLKEISPITQPQAFGNSGKENSPLKKETIGRTRIQTSRHSQPMWNHQLTEHACLWILTDSFA